MIAYGLLTVALAVLVDSTQASAEGKGPRPLCRESLTYTCRVKTRLGEQVHCPWPTTTHRFEIKRTLCSNPGTSDAVEKHLASPEHRKFFLRTDAALGEPPANPT